jgi:hypothetical protein
VSVVFVRYRYVCSTESGEDHVLPGFRSSPCCETAAFFYKQVMGGQTRPGIITDLAPRPRGIANHFQASSQSYWQTIARRLEWQGTSNIIALAQFALIGGKEGELFSCLDAMRLPMLCPIRNILVTPFSSFRNRIASFIVLYASGKSSAYSFQS